MVSKPGVNEVKKIALVSVYANAKVPESKGRGLVKNWEDSFKMQVAEDFLGIHSKSFRTIGWEVVNPDYVLHSAEYNDAFNKKPDTGNRTMNNVLSFVDNLAKTGYRNTFFSPAGMLPVQFSKSNGKCYGNTCGERPEQTLASFAKELNVDAVAVIQIDYCYEGGTLTSFGGMGQAFMTAATSIKVVNQSGEVVVNMPELGMCSKSKSRARSQRSMPMNGGDLVFAFQKQGKIRDMFRESAKSSSDLVMNQIRTAMHH